jgi:hypothetical protein
VRDNPDGRCVHEGRLGRLCPSTGGQEPSKTTLKLDQMTGAGQNLFVLRGVGISTRGNGIDKTVVVIDQWEREISD